MKFYLAGAYYKRPLLREINTQITNLGFESTSRWLYLEHSIENPGDADRLGPLYARHDHDDVKEADVLVFLTNHIDDPYTSGGRHVEFGLALAWQKPIIIYDPHFAGRSSWNKENIFHWYDRKVYLGNHLVPAITIIQNIHNLTDTLGRFDARLRESQVWAEEGFIAVEKPELALVS
jgi:hypothetical protein